MVPAVVTTFFPARSGKSRTPESLRVSRRVPTTKMRVRERHLLLALEVVRRRAALEVDGPVLHERDAVLRGDRRELDLEAREPQLLPHGLHHREHDLVRVADHLLLVVVVGERDRRLAVAEGDGPRRPDALERPPGGCWATAGARASEQARPAAKRRRIMARLPGGPRPARLE